MLLHCSLHIMKRDSMCQGMMWNILCSRFQLGKRHHMAYVGELRNQWYIPSSILPAVSRNESGEPLFRSQWSLFLVGEGNFGGPRKSTKAVPLMDHPNRAPDASEEVVTGIDQVRCMFVFCLNLLIVFAYYFL